MNSAINTARNTDITQFDTTDKAVQISALTGIKTPKQVGSECPTDSYIEGLNLHKGRQKANPWIGGSESIFTLSRKSLAGDTVSNNLEDRLEDIERAQQEDDKICGDKPLPENQHSISTNKRLPDLTDINERPVKSLKLQGPDLNCRKAGCTESRVCAEDTASTKTSRTNITDTKQTNETLPKSTGFTLVDNRKHVSTFPTRNEQGDTVTASNKSSKCTSTTGNNRPPIFREKNESSEEQDLHIVSLQDTKLRRLRPVAETAYGLRDTEKKTMTIRQGNCSVSANLRNLTAKESPVSASELELSAGTETAARAKGKTSNYPGINSNWGRYNRNLTNTDSLQTPLLYERI